MKRILILLVVFLLFGGGVFWYFFIDDECNKMMLVGFDWDFVIEDMSQLYKIFIVGCKGECIILVCDGKGGWNVEGGGVVNLNVMEFLFEVIKIVRIKYKLLDNVL